MSNDTEIMALLRDIHAQNTEMLARVDELEKSATKRGAVAGAVAGGITGSILTVGIELIKLKFGG